MLNHPDSFAEAGRRAAEARNQRDEARADHWARHFRNMRRLEKDEDRPTIDRLYHDAYQSARII